jgi:hypothetical protein
MGAEPVFRNNREGWVHLLEDCGYQYDFIAAQQIELGELRGYKVLILPYSSGFSQREAAAIRAFAQEGGAVIGDFQTGTADLPVTAPALLDDVFGIQRRNLHQRRFYTCQEMMPAKAFGLFPVPEVLEGFTFAEEGIRANGGTAAYYQDFNPAVAGVVVNAYGKGTGIYLNTSLAPYPELRKKGSGAGMRQLLNGLLGYTGVVKFCQLLDAATGQAIEAGYETVYYSATGARYAAVLRGMDDNRETGHDGLVVGASGGETESVKQIRLTFPEKAHIYDIRKGAYLGHATQINTDIAAGDAAVFALLEYKTEEMQIKTPDSVKPGEEFLLELAAVTPCGRNPASSVFTVGLYSPDGAYAWEYGENIACAGTHTLTRKLPLNAPKGVWTVTAKDVASGVRTETQITVG